MGATGVLPCNHFTPAPHAPHAARRATAAPGPGAAGAVTPGLRVAHSPPAGAGGRRGAVQARAHPGPRRDPLGDRGGKIDRHLAAAAVSEVGAQSGRARLPIAHVTSREWANMAQAAGDRRSV